MCTKQFAFLLCTLSACSTGSDAKLDAALTTNQWTAVATPHKGTNYDLTIFDGANKKIFETTCTQEFAAPHGKRLACATKSSIKTDKIQLVFRDDVKKGALRITLANLTRGKAHNLTCNLAAARLDCFEPRPYAGPARSGLTSPFPSTVPKLDLPNAHLISKATSKAGSVYRGMAPISTNDSPDLKSLLGDLHITSVVIYKDEADHEVRDEIDTLVAKGMKMNRIHHIPLKYKDFENFEEACTHTLEALQAISSEKKQKQNVFFHCTVGEDRTGMLAGVYRMLFEKVTIRSAFDLEMCEHGYASGNPRKPMEDVVSPINEELTPVFLKLAYKIQKKEISAEKLNVKVCEEDPEKEKEFKSSPIYKAANYRCGMSTWYQP